MVQLCIPRPTLMLFAAEISSAPSLEAVTSVSCSPRARYLATRLRSRQMPM